MTRRRVVGGVVGLAVALAMATNPFAASAETKTPRIAVQFGVTYLPLVIMKHHKLIEKHATAMGLEDVNPEWNTYSSGAAMNDALLSQNLDFAAMGPPPVLTIWDRTRGNINVKGVAAFSTLPQYLLTNNPNVKTLRDFTDSDRIAVPAVRVSIQAVLLQMAAAKEWGPENFDKLDHLTVSMGHPDGHTALMSGKSQITAHFSNTPFQYEAMKDPKIHRVLSSFRDILDGPASNGIIAATEKFHEENPTIFKAFIAALDEANEMISRDLRQASADFVAETKSSMSVEAVYNALTDEDVVFTSVPLNVMKYAEFMHARGTIRNKPKSWKDIFFPEIHDREGS